LSHSVFSSQKGGLPDLGEASGNLMSAVEEKRLGQAFLRSVLKSENLIADPLAQDYIRDLGTSLIRNSEHNSKHFNFFAIDNNVINAFAGPDGHIAVYAGLILTSETESELAAVMAHEISHVTQLHLFRSWTNTDKMSISEIAVLAAAVAIGVAAGGDAGLATLLGGRAAIIQNQINFIRSNEKEADRVGISLLNDAGYQPSAMPVFFKRMGRANNSASIKVPEYLRTHPITTSRISDSVARADQYPYKQFQDNIRYHLLRASLKSKTFSDARDAIIHFRSTLKEGRYRNREGEEYGLTLSLLRNNNFQEARKIMNSLTKQHPQTIEFIVTAANIDIKSKHYSAAIKRLEKAQNQFPFNLPIAISLSETYLFSNQPDKALKKLRVFIRNRPNTPYLYKLISRAASKNGNMALSHEHFATYYYLLGNIEFAVQQLKIALKQPKINEYNISRIEAKLESYSYELAELEKKKEA